MASAALIVFLASVGLLIVRNVWYSVLLLGVEGVALCGMVFLSGSANLEQFGVGAATLVIKAGIIPYAMYRVVKEWPLEYRNDRPLPWWGFVAGVVLLLSATRVNHLLSATGVIQNHTLFFYGLASIFLGFLQIVSRQHVLSQVGSLIAVENALVILATSVAGQLPLFMEFGMLIDLLVAVVILAWMSRLVHRQFNTTDVTVMRFLRR